LSIDCSIQASEVGCRRKFIFALAVILQLNSTAILV
jgi:hypothetical protein